MKRKNQKWEINEFFFLHNDLALGLFIFQWEPRVWGGGAFTGINSRERGVKKYKGTRSALMHYRGVRRFGVVNQNFTQMFQQRV